MFSKVTDRGVSPVIGVILLVALTVSLVALVSVFVLDIGDDVSETADATVDTDVGDDDVTATVVRNENLEEIRLEADSDSDSDTVSEPSAGDTLTATHNDEDVQVIGVVDGNEQVLFTVDV